MKIRFTSFGAGLVSSTIFLTVSSIAFKDLFLLITSIGLALLISTDLFLTYFVSRRCLFTSNIERDRAWVWEKIRGEIEIRSCPLDFELTDPSRSIVIEDVEQISKDSRKIIISLDFMFSGIHNIKNLMIKIYSILKIFIFNREVYVNRNIIVYPEYLYWLQRIVYIIGGERSLASSVLRETSQPPNIFRSILRSSAGEYYETREYSPGDDIKRVDWKATARNIKLMIKDLREPVGGGALIAYDLRCSGSYTCDSIASMILSIIYTVYQHKISPIYIYDMNKKDLRFFKDSYQLMRYIAEKILTEPMTESSLHDFYEYISPSEYYKMLDILREARGSEGLSKDPASDNLVGIISDEKLKDVVMISSVINGSSDLIDLVRILFDPEVRKIVMIPEKPWIDLSDVEERYIGYKTYENVIEDLRRHGCRIYVKKRRGFEVL